MTGSAVTAFTRSTLREQIKDVLLQRIVEGSLQPGSRIIETHVAQELGVSQGPVREALVRQAVPAAAATATVLLLIAVVLKRRGRSDR